MLCTEARDVVGGNVITKTKDGASLTLPPVSLPSPLSLPPSPSLSPSPPLTPSLSLSSPHHTAGYKGISPEPNPFINTPQDPTVGHLGGRFVPTDISTEIWPTVRAKRPGRCLGPPHLYRPLETRKKTSLKFPPPSWSSDVYGSWYRCRPIIGRSRYHFPRNPLQQNSENSLFEYRAVAIPLRVFGAIFMS